MPYRILLEKENFKFSCSHFTILGQGLAERLHGHNYYVSIEVRLNTVDPDLGLGFDFNSVKPIVRALTESLDEYVLLPAHSQQLKIIEEGPSIRATFGDKLYVLPKEDVKILPVVNICSEELARYIAESLAQTMNIELFDRVTGLSISVQETRGQSVWFEMEM